MSYLIDKFVSYLTETLRLSVIAYNYAKAAIPKEAPNEVNSPLRATEGGRSGLSNFVAGTSGAAEKIKAETQPTQSGALAQKHEQRSESAAQRQGIRGVS